MVKHKTTTKQAKKLPKGMKKGGKKWRSEGMRKNIKKVEKFLKKVLTKQKHRAIITTVAARNAVWGHSSAGRASALQAEGHRFEPYRFHSYFLRLPYGEIAQLARAHGSYPWCRGFESPSRYSFKMVWKPWFTRFPLFFCFKTKFHFLTTFDN